MNFAHLTFELFSDKLSFELNKNIDDTSGASACKSDHGTIWNIILYLIRACLVPLVFCVIDNYPLYLINT